MQLRRSGPYRPSRASTQQHPPRRSWKAARPLPLAPLPGGQRAARPEARRTGRTTTTVPPARGLRRSKVQFRLAAAPDARWESPRSTEKGPVWNDLTDRCGHQVTCRIGGRSPCHRRGVRQMSPREPALQRLWRGMEPSFSDGAACCETRRVAVAVRGRWGRSGRRLPSFEWRNVSAQIVATCAARSDLLVQEPAFSPQARRSIRGPGEGRGLVGCLWLRRSMDVRNPRRWNCSCRSGGLVGRPASARRGRSPHRSPRVHRGIKFRFRTTTRRVFDPRRTQLNGKLRPPFGGQRMPRTLSGEGRSAIAYSATVAVRERQAERRQLLRRRVSRRYGCRSSPRCLPGFRHGLSLGVRCPRGPRRRGRQVLCSTSVHSEISRISHRDLPPLLAH